MGITIKTKSELAIMREAGRITCGAIWYAGEKLRAGMSTLDVDKLVGEYYAKQVLLQRSLRIPRECLYLSQ